MNKIKGIALLISGSFVLTSYGQKTVSEGIISYSINTLNAAGKPDNLLTGATNTIYIKGASTKTEMASSLGKETTFHDGKLGTGTILKEYSGQKLMITLTKENWNAYQSRYNSLNFVTGAAKKEISGYACSIATATLKDKTTVLTVYYTNDINIINKEYLPLFSNLNGFPVEYELKTSTSTFKYTLQKIELSAVPAVKFEVPKTGYRIMTYDETQIKK